MTTITTRSGKGSPLTNNEVDANFTNLNDDKVEASGDSMTGNLSFGDNNKAIFGAGFDLEIFHSGSHSIIRDNGTGDLRLEGSNDIFLRSVAGEVYARFRENLGAELYYDNNQKFATTSTGIDVTGTVTADEANIGEFSTSTNVFQGNVGGTGARLRAVVSSNSNPTFSFDTDTDTGMYTAGANTLNFTTGGVQRIRLDSAGDISFYESTGTTPKLFWDSSAESLGIGNTSPTRDLTVGDTAASSYINIKSSVTNGISGLAFGDSGDDNRAQIVFDNSTDKLQIQNGGGGALGNRGITLDSSEKVGIGTSSPSNLLTISDATTAKLELNRNGTIGNGWIVSTDSAANEEVAIQMYNSEFRLYNNSTQNFTVTSGGNVGIGTSSVDNKFVVSDAGGAGLEFIPQTSNDRTTLLSYDRNASAYQTIDLDGLDVHFNTSGTERMRIDSSGVVQIGPSGSTGDRELRFETGSGSASGEDAIINSYRSNADLILKTNDTERMRIDASGNVGIGTSPLYGFHVQMPSDGSVGTAFRYIGATNNPGLFLSVNESTRDVVLNASGSTSANLVFSTTDERMRIDSSGEFTLGNPSAGSALQLDVSATGTDGVDIKSTYYSGGYGPMKFHAGGSERMRIDSSGNLIMTAGGTIRAGGVNDLILDAGESGTPDVYLQSGGSTKVKIEGSNGNVGIGTTSPTFTTGSGLEIQRDGPATLRIEDTGSSGKPFEIYSDDAEGYVLSGLGSGMSMIFKTISTEAMRIDTSQNVLVGKTNNTLSNDGTIIRAGGEILVTNTSDIVANFNRTGTDGSIVQLYKDGATVGSIGADGGAIYIGNTAGEKLKFHNGSGGSFYPATDNNNDLGATSNRFKDLYLSGGVYLGGTGSVNHLDDFEEGDHTTSITCTTSGTVTLNTTFDSISYVKVGRLVTVTGLVIVGSVSSPVGAFSISMPFSAASSGVAKRGSDSAAAITVHNGVSANSADYVSTLVVGSSALTVSLGDNPDVQTDSAQQLQAGTQIYFHISYPTN